jgi:hypothetical protein
MLPQANMAEADVSMLYRIENTEDGVSDFAASKSRLDGAEVLTSIC